MVPPDLRSEIGDGDTRQAPQGSRPLVCARWRRGEKKPTKSNRHMPPEPCANPRKGKTRRRLSRRALRGEETQNPKKPRHMCDFERPFRSSSSDPRTCVSGEPEDGEERRWKGRKEFRRFDAPPCSVVRQRTPNDPSQAPSERKGRLRSRTTLRQACSSECQGAQGAFKDSMIH